MAKTIKGDQKEKNFFFFNSIPYYYIRGKILRIHTFITEYSLFSVLKDPGNKGKRKNSCFKKYRKTG